MARREEGGVVADIQTIPLQIIPPLLLTVHNNRVFISVSRRETLQAPAASKTDCLQLGSKHFGPAYLSQAAEMM
jgi:hypothetical protein